MEAKTVVVDSSLLIDYFRKQNKSKSALYKLSDHYRFCVSSITVFEIKIGLKTDKQWNDYSVLMENIEILPLDNNCIDEAVKIYNHLKQNNNLIDLADLLIGATAISNYLPLATFNRKHFKHIPNVELLSIPID